MSARWRYTGVSLLIVGAIFTLYRFTVAPWIEPAAVWLDPGNATSVSTTTATPANRDLELEPFQLLFPVGSWERDKPIILENEQAKFLLQDYENLRDGRVKLTRCSILFMPEGEVDFAKPEKRLILLQAPNGAILQFDTPIDLARLKVGKMVGGQLLGQVRIAGTPSRPGQDDALEVLTSDVQTNEERLWTAQPVTARFGPHQLSGTELNLRWLPATGSTTGRRGPNVGGIESLELLRDVQMTLRPGPGSGLLPGDRIAPVAATAAVNEPPIEIRCQGSFLFNLPERFASFADQVQVQRAFPTGIIDRLQGDKLRIEFQPRAAVAPSSNFGTTLQPLEPTAAPATTATTTSKSSSAGALEPRRLIVDGRPVQVRAQSNQVDLDAEHVEYDLVSGRVLLDGKQEVQLRQAANQYRGRTVSYEPGAKGGLGRLVAQGPGKLTAVNNDAARSQFEVSFQQSLKLRPDEQNHVLSIMGQAVVRSTQLGQIQGDELHLWLIEQPKPTNDQPKPARTNSDLLGGGTASAVPDRMLASGKVAFQTPQIAGETNRLELWFDALGQIEAARTAAAPERDSASRIVPLQTNPNEQPAPTTNSNIVTAATPSEVYPTTNSPAFNPPANTNQPVIPVQPSNPSTTPIASVPSATPSNPAPAASRYLVNGELIRVQFAHQRGQRVAENITIDGQVDFREPNPQEPRVPNMLIQGEHLEVLQASLPSTQVTITGKPAKIAINGIETQGDTIRLDRMQNRVWVEGAGRLNLPPGIARPGLVAPQANNTATSNPLALNNLGQGGPIAIEFVNGMVFDGRQISLEKDVLVRMEQLRTPPQSSSQPAKLEQQIKEYRTIRTQQIVVTLKQRVDFQQPQLRSPTANRAASSTQPEIESLACNQGFVLETRADDLAGQPLDWQQLQARDLIYSPTTGAIRGTGPGEMISIRRSSSGTVLTAPGSAATENKETANALQYLKIDYRRALQGNLLQRTVTFDNQIQAVAGGIDSWAERLDPEHPEKLGSTGMVLNCEQLIVSESPAVIANQPSSIELQAVGNTVIEGAQFTGRGYRLTYAQAKDQLVLEGDGRNDAMLNYQAGPGLPSSRAAAGRLMFWPGSNRVDVDGGRMIDLSQLAPPPAKKSPPK